MSTSPALACPAPPIARPPLLRERYADRTAYLAAYERATDAAIAAGFVLPEDRDQVLAEARPEVVDAAYA